MSQSPESYAAPIRHDWSLAEILALLKQPFNDLLWQAQQVHRQHFDPNQVQLSSLLSIKTGSCPEDCAYCPQSAHHNTGLSKEKLLEVEKVLEQARAAKARGSERFCMGAAWRAPHQRDMPQLIAMVQGVKALGLESCMTLGMLSANQAQQLAQAGLDYYNHNLDTSPEYYSSIITTRTYADRLTTLAHVQEAGIKVCAGGIVGMGESLTDRAALLQQLANLSKQPDSVPLNQLVAVAGTPLEDTSPIDALEFVRLVAVARILMPKTYLRLSAGRSRMNEAEQTLCFMAGANSIFLGDKLLTTTNVDEQADQCLFDKLGINTQQPLYRNAMEQPRQAGIFA